MNGDHRYYHSSSPNAVAGPSKPPQMPSPPPGHGDLGGGASSTGVAGSSSSPPHQPPPVASSSLFLPPPAPPPPQQHLESTQDLLARFHLHSAYDRYVRPSIVTTGEAVGFTAGAGAFGASGDKGKGRDFDMGSSETGGNVGSEVVPGTGDGEEEDAAGVKGEKKMKNNYKHLIKGLPGKHSLKKDDFLATIMLVPPKQRTRIRPFDQNTQHDAFHCTPEGLKNWNPSALLLESAQAREDRKKRKELKRLGRLHQHAHPQQVPVVDPSQMGVPLQAPAPTTAQAASFKPQGSGTPFRNPPTPRSAAVSGGTPRPGSTVPRPGSTASRVGTPAATPVQTVSNAVKSSIPRPGSVVPRPGSTAPGMINTAVPPRPGSVKPSPVVASTPQGDMIARGVKRPREESGGQQMVNGNGTGVTNGAGNGTLPPRPILNAKAGTPGVRPRPKKQRIDGPGQPNGAVQQQPTPQGV
ncbi:hypothetical protein FA13DRAFT_1753727 [Coprinellus micaceus]|uniref:Mediator of RNA polymerase II transcription subunit 19 n=1 Tax=Coprinellus micaceus TaxID=71717 RepID=A0A4Y7TKT7_COPMI|nr:hypothetical protein FA13DRAFT_1753727 [Coprinellus micaceus]